MIIQSLMIELKILFFDEIDKKVISKMDLMGGAGTGSGWAPSAGQAWRQVMGKDGPASGELSAIWGAGAHHQPGHEPCPVVMTQVSLPLSSHLSRALAKRCLSAALKGAGPPVCTPAERSSSMKLRMPSRAWMVSRV